MSKFSQILFFTLLVILNGCTSYSRVQNHDLDKTLAYRDSTQSKKHKEPGEVQLFLSFSGGGTRAAAFSYGVLEELRDTQVKLNGKTNSLLSEVDTISSVSGGSFTSAYYGLYGEQIFERYEKEFLAKDIQGTLITSLFNPINWFRFSTSGFDRTELAIAHYDRQIFKGATFADFKPDGPNIRINATDLNSGQPFIFNQNYFNYLCSDVSKFKVSRAVTASSAVPVAFAPIVLKNYDNCNHQIASVFKQALKSAKGTRSYQHAQSLKNYLDKNRVKYIHLVDGGIADNLGLRASYDAINLLGGIKNYVQATEMKIPKYLVMIIVNSAVSPKRLINQTSQEPSLGDQIDAVTSAQMERYTVETLNLLKSSLDEWTKQLSKDGKNHIKTYLIHINFNEFKERKVRNYFNMLPTSLSLPRSQIGALKEAGRQLLRQNETFQDLLHDLH